MDAIAHPWTTHAVTFAIGFLLARAIYRVAPDTHAPAMPRRDITDEDVDNAIRAGQTIDAIKLYRNRSGAGLKEAKAAVEQRERELNIRR